MKPGTRVRVVVRVLVVNTEYLGLTGEVVSVTENVPFGVLVRFEDAPEHTFHPAELAVLS